MTRSGEPIGLLGQDGGILGALHGPRVIGLGLGLPAQPVMDRRAGLVEGSIIAPSGDQAVEIPQLFAPPRGRMARDGTIPSIRECPGASRVFPPSRMRRRLDRIRPLRRGPSPDGRGGSSQRVGRRSGDRGARRRSSRDPRPRPREPSARATMGRWRAARCPRYC